jgi:hypothetical protein
MTFGNLTLKKKTPFTLYQANTSEYLAYNDNLQLIEFSNCFAFSSWTWVLTVNFLFCFAVILEIEFWNT